MAEIQQLRARGIQEQDVWGAADALLAEGLRPTIGRGAGRLAAGA